MALPDGSKVEPNGTIHSSDGSLKSMGPGQAMTLDGRVIEAPIGGLPGANPSLGTPLFNPNAIPEPSSLDSLPSLNTSPGSDISTPGLNTGSPGTGQFESREQGSGQPSTSDEQQQDEFTD
jgi:hypothetical protein